MNGVTTAQVVAPFPGDLYRRSMRTGAALRRRAVMLEVLGTAAWCWVGFHLLIGPIREFEVRLALWFIDILGVTGISGALGDSFVVFPRHGGPFVAVLTASCSSLPSLLALSALAFVVLRRRAQVLLGFLAATVWVLLANQLRLILSLLAGRYLALDTLIWFHDWVGALMSFVYTMTGLLIMIALTMHIPERAEQDVAGRHTARRPDSWARPGLGYRVEAGDRPPPPRMRVIPLIHRYVLPKSVSRYLSARRERGRVDYRIGHLPPEERAEALRVLAERGLGVHTATLVAAAANETDELVLDALAESVAARQWEPVSSREIFALRLWARAWLMRGGRDRTPVAAPDTPASYAASGPPPPTEPPPPGEDPPPREHPPPRERPPATDPSRRSSTEERVPGQAEQPHREQHPPAPGTAGYAGAAERPGGPARENATGHPSGEEPDGPGDTTVNRTAGSGASARPGEASAEDPGGRPGAEGPARQGGGPDGPAAPGEEPAGERPAAEHPEGLPGSESLEEPAPATAVPVGRLVAVTGAGGPAGIAVIRALSRAGERVFALDADPRAAGLRLAAAGAVLPRADSAGYGDALVRAVQEYRPAALICTVAEEYHALRLVSLRLAELGCRTWLPPPTATDTCLDKAAFAATMLLSGVPHPPTALSPEAASVLPGPWVVKPAQGRGSRDIVFADTEAELARALATVPTPLAQTRIVGQEFTADVLLDRDGSLLTCVPRWRVETRGGISVRGTTFDSTAVTRTVASAVTAVGLTGPANVQGFVADPQELDDDPEAPVRVTVVEVNPRFSGGLPLTLAAGADVVGTYLTGILDPSATLPRLTFQPGIHMARYFAEVYYTADGTPVADPLSGPGRAR